VIGDRTGIAVLQRGRTEPVRATALQAAVNSALADLTASGEIRRLAGAAGFPYEP
jgi:hypothetical protein